MKSKDNGIRSCICQHLGKDKKSFYSKFDLVSGLIVLAALTIFLLIKDAINVFLVIVLPLLLVSWIVLFCIRLAKGHSFKCAARWAAMIVIGAVGGFWLVS
jgi:hypothetical protein